MSTIQNFQEKKNIPSTEGAAISLTGVGGDNGFAIKSSSSYFKSCCCNCWYFRGLPKENGGSATVAFAKLLSSIGSIFSIFISLSWEVVAFATVDKEAVTFGGVVAVVADVVGLALILLNVLIICCLPPLPLLLPPMFSVRKPVLADCIESFFLLNYYQLIFLVINFPKIWIIEEWQ